jgi:hypothetical protein
VSVGFFHHDASEDLGVPQGALLTLSTGAGTILTYRPVDSYIGPPAALAENSTISISHRAAPQRWRFHAIGPDASYSLVPDATPIPPS